jgi:hypothetical protein
MKASHILIEFQLILEMMKRTLTQSCQGLLRLISYIFVKIKEYMVMGVVDVGRY